MNGNDRSEGLFPAPASRTWVKGSAVTVQTMWGNEKGLVLDVGTEGGHPMAKILLDSGDSIYVNIARVTQREKD